MTAVMMPTLRMCTGTIVIGLSIDYCVHLGHAYAESSRFARELKMQA